MLFQKSWNSQHFFEDICAINMGLRTLQSSKNVSIIYVDYRDFKPHRQAKPTCKLKTKGDGLDPERA